MAGNIKGINVEIGGDTTKLTSALKNVNSATRNTQSELTAVNKLLKLDPSNLTLLTQKSEILATQISNVKGKLQTLESVQAQVQKQFESGDLGADEYRAFQREIESARGHLARLESQSKETDSKLKNTGGSADDTGKELKAMGDKANSSKKDFNELKSSASSLAHNGLDVIKKSAKTVAVGLTAAVAGVGAAGAAVISATGSTAEAGDEVDKQSQKIGISAERYQQLSYAANLCGTNMNTMKTAAKHLESSGSKLDLTEAITQVASISDESERSAKAIELFGTKAAQELKPMLNQGADGVKSMLNSASELGLVMSNDSVAAAAKYQDSLATLTTTMSAVKNGIVSNLLPGFTTVMDGITALFTGDSGATKKIESGLNSMVESIKAMAPRFTSIVTTIGSAVTEVLPTVIATIVSTLNTLDIGNTIIKPISESLIECLPLIADVGFDIINSLIGVLVQPQTISSLATTAMTLISSLANSLVAALPTLLTSIVTALPSIITQLTSALVELLPTIISGITQVILAILDSLPEILQTLIDALPTIIQTLITALTENLPLIIEGITNMLVALVENLPTMLEPILESLPTIISSIITALLSMLPQLIDAGIQLLTALVGALPEIITQIVEVLPQIINGIITALLDALPQIIDAGIRLFLALIDALPQIIETIVDNLPKIITGIINGLLEALPKLIEAGIKLFVAIIQNTPKIIAGIVTHIPEIIMGIVESFGSLIGSMAEIGGNIVKGLWDGITGLASWLWEQVSGWISGIWDGICDFFGIHSPSRLFRDELGKNLMLGMAVGIDSNADEVQKSIDSINESVADTSISAMSNLNTDLAQLNAGIGEMTATGTSYLQGTSKSNTPSINISFGDVTINSDDDIEGLADKIDVAISQRLMMKGMAWG